MKLKLALLVMTAFAGAGASVALADHGGGKGKEDHAAKCKNVHLSGQLAAGSLSLTVAKGNKGTAAGSTVALVLPAGARANVQACVTGTGATAAYTVRKVEIQVKAPKPEHTTTTATTTAATTTTTP